MPARGRHHGLGRLRRQGLPRDGQGRLKRRDAIAGAFIAAAAIAGVAWLLAHRTAPGPSIDAEVVETAAPPIASAGNILDFIVFDAYVPPPPSVCELLASRNDSVFAALAAHDGCAPSKLDSLPCVTVGSATWAIAVDHATVDAECATQITVKLVRLGADAGVEASGAPIDANETWSARNTFTIRDLGDYDGDGSPEVLVEHSIDAHSAGTRTDATMWTIHGARVGRYAPAAKIVIAGAEDVDGDGRIDLLTRGPYESIEADESYMSPRIAPAIFVAHSMSDGTFLEGDPASRAYTRGKCKAAARSLAGTREAADEDALAIVCAALHGVMLTTDASSSWRGRLATVAPPFALQSDGGS